MNLLKVFMLIKGIYIIIRGFGVEMTDSADIVYKEKRGKYDIISPQFLVSSAYRYPTCNFI